MLYKVPVITSMQKQTSPQLVLLRIFIVFFFTLVALQFTYSMNIQQPCNFKSFIFPNYNIQNTIYNIQYTIYNIQYTIYNILYTIYNIQYTKYNIQYTIYNIQYTIYNIQYTIYNIQYTIYRVRAVLTPVFESCLC